MRERITAQSWGFKQNPILKSSALIFLISFCSLCSNTTDNFTVNKPASKMSILLLCNWTCYVLIAHPPELWDHAFTPCCVWNRQQQQEMHQSLCSPYLLYHLCTACWKPPSNQRSVFQERKGVARFGTGWCPPHTIFPGSSAEYVVISIPPEMETFERGR